MEAPLYEDRFSEISDPKQQEKHITLIRSLLQDEFGFTKGINIEVYRKYQDECQLGPLKSALSFLLFSFYADFQEVDEANEYIKDAHDFIVQEYKLPDHLKNHSYHLYKMGHTSYIYPGSDFYDSTILQRGGGYKEAFEFRMATQPTYGGALKGIGHTRSRRFLVVIFKWGKDKDCMFILTAYPAKRKHVEIYMRTTGGVL